MAVYEDYLNKMQRMFPTGARGPAQRPMGSGSTSDKEYRALQQALANKAGSGSGATSDREMRAYINAIGGGGPISDRDAALVRSQPVTRGALPPPAQRATGPTSDIEAAALERAKRVYMQQMQSLMQRDVGSGPTSDIEFQKYQDSLGTTPQDNFDALTNFFLNFNTKLRGR
jgi:hypothetical protein